VDWLVGMAPSDPNYRGPALTPTGGRTSSADRLRTLLDMSVEEFLRAYPDRENALNYAYGRLLARRVTGRVAVFGVDAWRMLGLPSRRFWESYQTKAATFYLLPHPSGRCRLYNTGTNRVRLRRLFWQSSPLRSATTGWSLREQSCRDPSGSRPASGFSTGRR
jgi:hypothetical protein